MEASSVEISPETLKDNELTHSKRIALKKQLIIELVKRKPYGTKIKMPEFQKVTGDSSIGSLHSFVARMIANGELIRHSLGPKTFFYTVPSEVTVSKPVDNPEYIKGKRTPFEQIEDLKSMANNTIQVPKALQGPALSDVRRFSVTELEAEARSWSWYHSDGTLPEFILHLKDET